MNQTELHNIGSTIRKVGKYMMFTIILLGPGLVIWTAGKITQKISENQE